MKKLTGWKAMFSLAMAALILTGGAQFAMAEDEEDELEFDEANVFFELNNTDGDLGIHALIDGEPWKKLTIETPDERQNLIIRLRGKLRRQGLTELFFESAEPTFDELDPADFFARFPEGIYDVDGVTIEGEEIEGEAEVTHLLPAPPANVAVNGQAVPESCDDGPVPAVNGPVTVTWDAVTHSHPDLGRTNEAVTVDRYQVVVEREDGDELKFTLDLPSNVTSVLLPAGLMSSGDEIKIEILAREESGNQTAMESCFEIN